MIKRPTVSVIMPVYNGEAYLAETIESILNQTYTDFECVIVDDGSKDGSWEMLSRYAAQDARIILKRNEQNIGACTTSNLLLTLAQGELIARQDQDDIALPKRLAAQIAYMNDHPEVGLLGTAYYRLNTTGQRRLRRAPATHTGIRWRLLFDCAFCHTSVMLRRSLFDSGELYYREPACVQDYDLWARLVKHTQAGALSTPLLIYRELQHSMTSMYADSLQSAITAVSAEQIRALLPQRPLPLDDINALRRLHSPNRLGQMEMTLGQTMFDLLDAFANQPDVDPAIVSDLRRGWIKRLLSGTPPRQWVDLYATGLLAAMLHKDARAALPSLFVRFPKWIMQRFARSKRRSAQVER